MRKILIFLGIILLVACSKDEVNDEKEVPDGNEIVNDNEIEEINRIVANDSIYFEVRYPDNAYYNYGIKSYGRKKRNAWFIKYDITNIDNQPGEELFSYELETDTSKFHYSFFEGEGTLLHRDMIEIFDKNDLSRIFLTGKARKRSKEQSDTDYQTLLSVIDSKSGEELSVIYGEFSFKIYYSDDQYIIEENEDGSSLSTTKKVYFIDKDGVIGWSRDSNGDEIWKNMWWGNQIFVFIDNQRAYFEPLNIITYKYPINFGENSPKYSIVDLKENKVLHVLEMKDPVIELERSDEVYIEGGITVIDNCFRVYHHVAEPNPFHAGVYSVMKTFYNDFDINDYSFIKSGVSD